MVLPPEKILDNKTLSELSLLSDYFLIPAKYPILKPIPHPLKRFFLIIRHLRTPLVLICGFLRKPLPG